MELIQQINVKSIDVKGYSFLSLNNRGIKTTAYFVSDDNYRRGIELSLFTANNDVTINVSACNLFYNNDLTFDEAYISCSGGMVEEDRQACIELLTQAKSLIPKKYRIQHSWNISINVIGEENTCLK